MPTITWGELTELIKAVASLAWPIVAFILMLMFKGKLRDLLSNRKLKGGKIFGQEFELEAELTKELNRLEKDTTPYATTTRRCQPPRPQDRLKLRGRPKFSAKRPKCPGRF